MKVTKFENLKTTSESSNKKLGLMEKYNYLRNSESSNRLFKKTKTFLLRKSESINKWTCQYLIQLHYSWLKSGNLHWNANIFGTVLARMQCQTSLESWEGMPHGNIDSIILLVILCPKIPYKVWLFSAENGPTLNAVCDRTIYPRSFRN